LFISEKYTTNRQEEEKETMSEEGDTFWVSLSERFFGLILIIIGGVLLYLTATSAEVSGFGVLFGFLSIVLVVLGIFLLIVKPPE
jgi:hypothetical protein